MRVPEDKVAKALRAIADHHYLHARYYESTTQTTYHLSGPGRVVVETVRPSARKPPLPGRRSLLPRRPHLGGLSYPSRRWGWALSCSWLVAVGRGRLSPGLAGRSVLEVLAGRSENRGRRGTSTRLRPSPTSVAPGPTGGDHEDRLRPCSASARGTPNVSNVDRERLRRRCRGSPASRQTRGRPR